MRAYLTEFIGTFFLVLTVCLCLIGGTPLAPLAIGGALMVMVFMGGYISGGHYNPAVSLAVYARGKLPPKELGLYIAAQVVGGLVAAFVAWLITGKSVALAPSAAARPLEALLVEILFTFALALVVLHTATTRATANNSFYGLAIGGTLAVAVAAGGAISGGAFNPAVATGPALIHAMFGGSGIGHLWLYWLGPLVGGALAAGAFYLQVPDEMPTKSAGKKVEIPLRTQQPASSQQSTR